MKNEQTDRHQMYQNLNRKRSIYCDISSSNLQIIKWVSLLNKCEVI